jgi:uncharacterized membrane protein YdbT with pleckstrin-like domain
MSDSNKYVHAKSAGEDGKIQYVERKRWLFLGLPFTFTKYTIGEDVLTIDTGFFHRDENDCYMYKVQDVQYCGTFLERIVGLGSIICFTGDTTDPKLEIRHIKHAKEVKNFILEASEKARIKRRTMNMLNIGAAGEDMDMDTSEMM